MSELEAIRKEQAQEINRLEAENKRLRDALEKIVKIGDEPGLYTSDDILTMHLTAVMTLQALKGGE